MIKCSHCSLVSNNYRFCEGCGRELKKPVAVKYEELPEGSTRFLDVAVEAVEAIFFPENVECLTQINIGASALNLHEIVKDAGIYIVDGMQWQNVGNKEKKKMFFNDVFLMLGLSLIFVSGSVAVSVLSLSTLFKFWFSGYIFVSFILWFIFPFLSGATVFSLSGQSGLFIEEKTSVKGSVYHLMLLFLFMQLYIFIPFLLIEYAVAMKKQNYIPFAMRVSGVDFLIRTGGDY